MDAITGRIIRNLGANGLGAAITAIAQVVTVPILLSMWRGQLFGEWLLVSTLPGWLLLSDLGLTSVAATEMTIAVAANDRQRALAVFQSTWVGLLLLLAALLPALALLAAALPWTAWLQFQLIGRGELIALTVLFLLQVACSQHANLLAAGLRCDGLASRGVMWLNAQRLSDLLVTIAIVSSGYGPVALASMLTLARVLLWMLMARDVCRQAPWLNLGVEHAGWSEIRRLAVPALAFMAFPAGFALRLQGTLTLVGLILGPAAVAAFSTIRTLTHLVQSPMSIINAAVWPEISVAFGGRQFELLRTLHRRTCQLSLVIMLVAVIGLALCAPWLHRFWTRGETPFDARVLHFLLAGLVVHSCWYASSVVPAAMNRHQGQALVFLSAAVFSFMLMVLLIGHLGTSGAALGLIVTDVVMAGYVLKTSLRLTEDTWRMFAVAIMQWPRPWFHGAAGPSASVPPPVFERRPQSTPQRISR